ncbi:polyamine aminopropyltransferase [Microvirga guangxiensis]|uniref:Polyamine aminopropyltransferase n=1 Tax=Microvirga guangxiensis TaxID=549386 RepID=A0A1G5H262_9HYPH|nr:polyamine aminopropyltransferase [Microvirga guangxiensis]SCY57913.1 spermidine synthase [Microvirga guangxiensis]
MNWFQEKLYEHHKQMLSMDSVLYHWRTEFQDVLIFENATFGKVLVLDGILQLTERDNHIYHEMIAHVPLMAHGSARDVLIIGGGDGGTLKEVLKHPVERATLVEIDGEVIDLSRRFLPDVSSGAFDDPRANVLVMDGTRYIAETEDRFDVIIIDSTDPMGPGEPLFTADFYKACRRRLRPGGMIVVQSGAPFFQPGELEMVCQRLSGSFPGVRPYLAPVPTYAGGMLALVAAAESRDALRPPIDALRERFGVLQGRTRYYSPEVHRAAFALAPSYEPFSLREDPVATRFLKTGS